ncbi:ABC transporter ATP-binding protein (plasmid) [Cupriavidus sp. P-10]|uniref:ABC transporter ATP-binding protein n=1 Tax=Cupriavidus sp. P-10 TaxID=2027911 RepID=UPI001F3DD594|nr:ABC transporter ATP-binding protein [Cupriavidus sp. P-10]BDB29415.1 ABC transporter ATP-binding protein [Cupriavidus sp. P-10]
MAKPISSLVVKNLRVDRGTLPVLHGLDLRLESGRLTVLGRNGAGKSTLCLALMGMLPASGGSIMLDGVELVGKSPHEVAAAGITLVPQGRRVFPSLTVDEHMRLMEGRHPGNWNTLRVYEALPRLAERKTNYGNQLSGGEKQMLAIARALLTNPRLMILDEPSEGLSPLIVETVLQLIADCHQEGIAILLVEQNMRAGLAAADDVALMAGGRIAQTTTSRALVEDEELQQQYLGIATH